MVKSKSLPPLEDLQKAFKVDPESPSGLIWNTGRNMGCMAGGIRDNQYWYVKYKKESWACHRIIWALVFGVDPGCFQIDHIDQNKQNNKIENLRLASAASNCHNRQINQEIKKKKTSRYKGVYWHKTRSRWRARIVLNRKSIELGRFITEEEAALAYDKAALRLYGEFAVLNMPQSIGFEELES